MAYAASRKLETSQIPVINLAPLLDGTNPGKVAADIHAASREVGFLYASHHGIAQDLIELTRELGLTFFRQPMQDKLPISVNEQHRGFLKIGGAKMYDGAKADLKESFVWGYEPSADGPAEDQDRRFRGNNQWPTHPPALRQTACRYFDAVDQVARHLLRAFAIGLELPEQTFLAGAGRPLSRGSFVYYPPQPDALGEDQFGVAPHTDFGVLTVLCQDHLGGLQVENYDGEWVTADPIPGTLVINVGDLLARWTNDRYRSTPHRVINSSGQERLSLVVAYDPDYDTLIDPSIVCTQSDVPKYEPISCGDYLTWRFRKAFGYRK